MALVSDTSEAGRMSQMAAYIDAHAGETLTLARLGKVAGMSPTHLQRVFTATLGISPKAYQAARRLAALKAGLRAGESVLGAVFDAGAMGPPAGSMSRSMVAWA